jgi:hypothetical protein
MSPPLVTFAAPLNISGDNRYVINLTSAPAVDSPVFNPVFKVQNLTVDALNAYLILSAYDADGRLIKNVFTPFSVTAGGTNANVAASLTKPANTAICKFFLWDSNYIPLTTTNMPSEDDPSVSEIILTVTNGADYILALTAENLTSGVSMYQLEYDATTMQVVDLAAHTWSKDLTIGAVPETNITILSVTAGSVVFSVNHDAPDGQKWLGVADTIRFRAISDGEAAVRFAHVANN